MRIIIFFCDKYLLFISFVHRIGIKLLSPCSYCLDGYRLTGRMSTMLQCFEICGITTIPISHYRWDQLEDAEKIPYLMDKINQCVPVTPSYKGSNDSYQVNS